MTDLQSYLKEKIASYKLPRVMKVVSSVPRNEMGKVNKRKLVPLFDDFYEYPSQK